MSWITVCILGLAYLVFLEMAAYKLARTCFGMGRPRYWLIPGAGFVLLYRALRDEDRQ